MQLLVLAKRCEEVGGCVDADFCRETGIVSILVELGLELSADWKELLVQIFLDSGRICRRRLDR